MLLIRVRNSVQNVCTLQPLVDLKYLFIYVKFTILCTYFVQFINNVQSFEIYDSVPHK